MSTAWSGAPSGTQVWGAMVGRILAIVIAACFTAGVLQGLIRRFSEHLAQRMDKAEACKRAATLGRVFRYPVAVVMSMAAGVPALAELDRWDESAMVRHVPPGFLTPARQLALPELTAQ